MTENRKRLPQRLPHGQSEAFDWGGYQMLLQIIGEFVTAGGVSTVVTLHHQVRRADGVLERGQLDGKEFRAAGDYTLNVPAGPVWFHVSGPTVPGKPLHISCTFEPIPPKAREPTLEQRISALERGASSPSTSPDTPPASALH